MKCLILSFLFSFLGLLTCQSQIIYVSSSQGDDLNDGLTMEKPLKTVSLALLRGKQVLLKSGDVFYSKGITVEGQVLSHYGNGDNPVVSGYKRILTPKWSEIEKHIWKLSLVEDNFSGVELGSSSMSNNIGCIHEYDKDLIHGHKVQYYKELKKNWDIWQTEHYERDTPPTEFDYIYLYYEGNPNQLKIEFSITDAAMLVSNSIVDGIAFNGYGFGISAGTNTTIRNCKIDAIGGRIQVGYEAFAVYGNGIEFWTVKELENSLVENCIISRCYDCGCTIQGTKYDAINIKFRKNVIVDCCQGWEDVLSSDNPDDRFKNCVFEDNIVINSGKTTGFDYKPSRFKYCHILGNNYRGDKGMIIRNNTFVGGNYYCCGAYKGKYKSNVWQGNTCVIKRGDYLLSNYFGTADVIRVPTERGTFKSLKAATDDAIRRYRELTGDETSKFIIKKGSAIDRKIAQLKKKYLK